MDHSGAKRRRNGEGGDRDWEHETNGEKTGEESGDLISRLPVELSMDVFYRLETIYGVRAAAVCNKWREIWLAMPLIVDDQKIGPGSMEKRVHIIDCILRTHKGPIRRLSLSTISISPYVSLFDRLVERILFIQLDELRLVFPGTMRRRQGLPARVLQFPFVSAVSINNCSLSMGTELISDRLTVLELHRVDLVTETLEHMLSRCPDITRLRLSRNTGYTELSLRLQKLRCLFVVLRLNGVSNEEELQNLIIWDAKNLELLYVNQYAYGPSVTILGAPCVQTLGYFGVETPQLEIGLGSQPRGFGNSIFLQYSVASTPYFNSLSYFRSIRTLALKMHEPDVAYLADFLHCFPDLQTLHLHFHNRFFDDPYPWERSPGETTLHNPHGYIACLEKSLKSVFMWYCGGVWPPVELANYFIKRATVLECITFATRERVCVESWTAGMNIGMRASARAQFRFCIVVADQVSRLMDHPDPFVLPHELYHTIIGVDDKDDGNDNNHRDNDESSDVLDGDNRKDNQDGDKKSLTDTKKNDSSSGQQHDVPKSKTCSEQNTCDILHNKYAEDKLAHEPGIQVFNGRVNPQNILPAPLLKYDDPGMEKVCASSVGQWNINKGTRRPTDYHVLYDENYFTAAALSLTAIFATHAVSEAYYAHLVSFHTHHCGWRKL